VVLEILRQLIQAKETMVVQVGTFPEVIKPAVVVAALVLMVNITMFVVTVMAGSVGLV
jgi:hypothetical protein